MNEPKVRSFISRSKGYIISTASVIDIMSEYLDHYVNSSIETVKQEDFDHVKKVLAYTCCMAPFMPADGVYGWTFSLPLEKRKIFSSLNRNDGNYVCRTHNWEPDKHEKTPRVALQMLSENQNINRVSLVDIDTVEKREDIIEALMERYFSNQEEVNVFTMFRDNTLYILKPFPTCADEVFTEVVDELQKGLDKVTSKLEILENYKFSFFCGCNSVKISHIFSSLKQEEKDFLFQKDDTITVECPRCGRKYNFKRDELCQ